MNRIRKQRLSIIIFIVIGISISVGLALFALRQNINLYFIPAQVNAGLAPKNHVYRIGGFVEPGSIRFDKNDLKVQFNITYQNARVAVVYQGILPDLFKAGQGVVVEGYMQNTGIFHANQVLAKHGAEYMPPGVKPNAS